jgi:exodeoxyribonuclease-3
MVSKKNQKVFSWNVNGYRSAWGKGFEKFLIDYQPAILGLQEIKVNEDQLDLFQKNPQGYHSVWFSAEKAGYSGVAFLTQKEPIEVYYGMNQPEFDREGRVLTLDMGDWVAINAYFPNSQRDHARLDYKLRFCKTMRNYCDQWVKKGKKIILMGDYNIAHQEIDLKNPKTNHETAGFLPEERSWMESFVGGQNSAYLDTFREFEKGGGHYSWWSYRPGVREKNIGWRIDYHCINQDARDQVTDAGLCPEVKGSDHCPVWVQIKK